MPDQVLAPIEEARALYRKVRNFPRILRSPNLSAITASQDSNVDLPTKGYTYRSIILECFVGANRASEAVMLNDITKIQAIVDGDTKIDLSQGATDLAAIMRYYQTRAGVNPIAQGCLRLDFVRPWHREIAGEDGPAWGMDDVRNFQLVVGFGSSITITAVNVWAVVSDPEPLGRHLCIRRFPRSFGSAAVDRESKWKNDVGTNLLAIHVNKAAGSGGLSSVKLTTDKIIEMEDVPVLLWHQQAIQYERTPQTNWSHLEFALRGRLRDGIPMIAGEMNVDFTWGTTPNAHTLLVETTEGPAA